jgi:hypothetical protein
MVAVELIQLVVEENRRVKIGSQSDVNHTKILALTGIIVSNY